MLARVSKAMNDKDRDKGFTLIELLVVIIIIGILAAIAIPAFLNQREKAWASQVESDLKNAAIAAESYAVDQNGSYVGDPALEATASADGESSTNWKAVGFNGTEGVSVAFATADGGNSYTLTATHTSLADDTWTYTSTDGKIVKS